MSTSGSWSGAPRDIFDLDRLMRSTKPPSSKHHMRNGLVVDNGSLTRRPASSDSSKLSPHTAAPAGQSVLAGPTARDKRFSHDSGLSDGSYTRRRRRSYRRLTSENLRHTREARASESARSLRAFRSVCERALRDQQQQMDRIEALCSRLERRRLPPTTTTSDVSSTSGTRDKRRADKRRTDECKTYKMIISRLDELWQMNGKRPRPAPSPRGPRPHPSSSSSVCVSNKLVTTEAEPEKILQGKCLQAERRVMPSATRQVERVVCGDCERTRARNCDRASALGSRCEGRSSVQSRGGDRTSVLRLDGRSERSRRLAVLQTVTNAHALDIPPGNALQKRESPNVVTERIQYESTTEASSSNVCDPNSVFNVKNQLFSQPKRPQAFYVTSHSRTHSRAGTGSASSHGVSLCALCRGYMRTLRLFLAAQLCGTTEPCVF